MPLRSAPQRALLSLRATRSHPPLPRPRPHSTNTKSNPTSQFYKTFTRPVGKVLVLAVFTYQVAYWTWTKLEADEARAEADATIAQLEAKVDEYKRSRKGR